MMTEKRRDNRPQSAALFDELLVIMVQQGDRSAMERLYMRWHIRLRRAALRYTGDSELARDLAQETWLGIWKGIGKLRDPSRFRAFAFGVLQRRGADYLRKKLRDRSNSVGMPEPMNSKAAPQEDRVAIDEAFAALPPDQRLAAHLHFLEGLTLREIGQVLGIPEGTAKSRLFHIRRKLKAALSPESQIIEGETV